MGIYKFLYVRNSELISNLSTVKTFMLFYHKNFSGKFGTEYSGINIVWWFNKNAFQSKAHLPLANKKSNTYNVTLEWPWPWYDLDLRQVKPS